MRCFPYLLAKFGKKLFFVPRATRIEIYFIPHIAPNKLDKIDEFILSCVASLPLLIYCM